LTPFDPNRSVPFVGEAIRRFRDACDRPIIGFAGAPFTLAAYLVEGGPSREYAEVKRWMYRDPDGFGLLLDRLTEMTESYLRMQATSGASVLQLFDTWAGVLSTASFDRQVAPHLRRLMEALRDLGRPTIYFSTGSSHLLDAIRGLGATAIGVDWRMPLGSVRARLGAQYPLQGNLDPGALLGTPEALEREAQRVLDEIPQGGSHVFNLGHGVLPSTDPQQVARLVDFVHAHGEARR
jgi:uroporphyrinogen decarboxylase